MALFIYLIICLFQLVFLAETMFFSYNKLVGKVFRLIFSAKRTGPIDTIESCSPQVKAVRSLVASLVMMTLTVIDTVICCRYVDVANVCMVFDTIFHVN